MGTLKFSTMLRAFLFTLLCAGAGCAHCATILVFGDSLSAGYGLPQGAGWVSLLERRLGREHYDYKVVNASISGETTTGGKNRIGGALMQYRPDVVIVELGGNDGLQGANVETIHANLAAIVAAARRRNVAVLLVGMQLPPNYGTAYADKFRSVYAAVAKSQHVPLVPFLLEGFAAERDAFQPDGIHPGAALQPRMLDLVWKHLQPVLAAPGVAAGRDAQTAH
jgi:acyl-CoA thioesterase-1